ncbi:MarR family transcriptional regulator [Labrys miyagiensis]|uniref:MarR family transcriptional regulator n=1 Tax=Labrys miyagiensis TaxID=346912 RepID=A0ABQ6CNB5_9HYPH|nr:helix-turn-helix domain-containing protein [Labrys miyagiensis]GLS21811.1 MarR family transcriptional regulator [Labrys miyagiensis]
MEPIDYAALAQFRYELRKFLAFSENAAVGAGLTGQQHQALLAIRGLSPGELSISELAEILLLRHHSVVELVDRLVKLGLAVRVADPRDGRRALIRLTPLGEEKLQALSSAHLKELASIGPALTLMLQPFHVKA